METINVLHLSDIHIDTNNKAKIERQLKTLWIDIEQQTKEGGIDLVLVTGDITFSGTREEFDCASEIFFDKIVRRLHVNKKKIAVCAGNHDIDRSRVDVFEDEGLDTQLTNCKIANEYLSNKTFSNIERLENYNSFIHSYFKTPTDNCHVQFIDKYGIKVGIACFNSSWRCFKGSGSEVLYLTEYQVDHALEQLEDCHVKIAIMHHPVSDLKDEGLQENLFLNFDFIASGHVHKTETLGIVSPNFKCVTLRSHATYTEHYTTGYNIYNIDYPKGKLDVHYRKFISGRGEYDFDIDNAKGGRASFDINLKNLEENIVLCRKISETKNNIDSDIKKQLSIYQDRDSPIFVTPNVTKVVKTNTKSRKELDISIDVKDLKSSIIYGPDKSGKTIFLENLVSKINSNVSINSDHIAIYHDLEEELLTEFEFQNLLNSFHESFDDKKEATLVLCLDHLNQENAVSQCNLFKSFETNNVKFYISTKNQVSFNNFFIDDWEYLEINYWGPTRIRELAQQWFDGSSIDINQVCEFIKNSLQNSDLPATPIVICLYLQAFSLCGGKVTSLSFLELLEKIETSRLSSEGSSIQQSTYHKKMILMKIAILCCNKGINQVSERDTIMMIDDYFSTSGHEVNSAEFLDSLISYGFLIINSNDVSFRYYIFFDYYLAKACKEGLYEHDKLIRNLTIGICHSEAISLYSGLFRENKEIAYAIIKLMENEFKPTNEFNLKNLDSLIKGLSLGNTSSVEDVILNDRETKNQLESTIDQDFLESQLSYTSERQVRLFFISSNAFDQEFIVLKQLYSLRLFYNSFRNLEGIPLEDKILLLDDILSYHIECNMSLITDIISNNDEKDFKSIIAYFWTSAGQAFMSEHMYNENLSKTLTTYLEQCTNDFKKMLVVCLCGDLKVKSYTSIIKEFIETTDSKSAIEIMRLKIRQIITRLDSENIPIELISLLKLTLSKRKQEVSDHHWENKQNQNNNIIREIESVKKNHKSTWLRSLNTLTLFD